MTGVRGRALADETGLRDDECEMGLVSATYRFRCGVTSWAGLAKNGRRSPLPVVRSPWTWPPPTLYQARGCVLTRAQQPDLQRGPVTHRVDLDRPLPPRPRFDARPRRLAVHYAAPELLLSGNKQMHVNWIDVECRPDALPPKEFTCCTSRSCFRRGRRSSANGFS